ncbi:ferric reduction oxidase 2 [Senna tora]|uniref:Ferric reduction oxidase 2 n=1 Tax=Senna tora TaxID=362788 RepID=A0A834TVF2_9FABA|nr:ferric reduction oxidase 2 [Senna tora]
MDSPEIMADGGRGTVGLKARWRSASTRVLWWPLPNIADVFSGRWPCSSLTVVNGRESRIDWQAFWFAANAFVKQSSIARILIDGWEELLHQAEHGGIRVAWSGEGKCASENGNMEESHKVGMVKRVETEDVLEKLARLTVKDKKSMGITPCDTSVKMVCSDEEQGKKVTRQKTECDKGKEVESVVEMTLMTGSEGREEEGVKPRKEKSTTKEAKMGATWKRVGPNKWNSQLIMQTFEPEVSKAILGIPLSRRGGEDIWMWSLTGNGIFSVKTAYKVVHKSYEASNGWSKYKQVWKRVWNMKDFWRQVGVATTVTEEGTYFADWFEAKLKYSSAKEVDVMCMMMQRIWARRNKLRLGEDAVSLLKCWDEVNALWCELNEGRKDELSNTGREAEVSARWDPPHWSNVKVNVDAGYDNNGDGRIGCVIRNYNGRCLAAKLISSLGIQSIEYLEALAILEGIKFAKEMSCNKIEVEGMVMVSGGSGITPFISIIRSLLFRADLDRSETPRVLLICAFKNSLDLTMLDLILPPSGTISNISNLQLQIEAYVTREKEEPLKHEKKAS